VQLQVVCHRLWSKLLEEKWKKQTEGPCEITRKDVEGCANVNQALAGYYADKVKQIAADPEEEVSERVLRDWFENHLISEKGIRGQVLRDEQTSNGLSNTVIEKLIDAYLVREESRRGGTWFELAHDRLIDPIRQDNSAWREANLNPVQILAISWIKGNEDQSLLPSSTVALDEALRWLDEHESELTPTERHFRHACRVLREKITQTELALRKKRRERVGKARLRKKQLQSARARRLAYIIIAGSLILATVAIIGWVKAIRNADAATIDKLLAEGKTRVLTSRRISEEARKYLDLDPGRSLFLALIALEATYSIQSKDASLAKEVTAAREQAKDVLSLALNDSQIRYVLDGQVSDLGFTSDGNRLVTAGNDGMKIWDAISGKQIAACKDAGQGLQALAFAPDGKSVALLGTDSIKIIDTETCKGLGAPVAVETNISAIALGTDTHKRTLLATGNSNGNVRIFDLDESRKILKTFKGSRERIQALAFKPLPVGTLPPRMPGSEPSPIETPSSESPSDQTSSSDNASTPPESAPADAFLLIASNDTKMWAITDNVGFEFKGQAKVLAFSQDGKFMITAHDKSASVWDTNSWSQQNNLDGHTGAINSIAFSRNNVNGSFVATASDDKSLIVWDVGVAKKDSVFATVTHDGVVQKVAFSPDGKHLATVADGKVKIWFPNRALKSVQDVAFSPKGQQIASLSGDGMVNVRDIEAMEQATFSVPRVGQESFKHITFDPNTPGNVVIVSDGRATQWVIKGTIPTKFVLEQSQMTSIAYSKKNLAATGNAKGQLQFWNTLTSAPDREPVNVNSKINAITFSPDDQFVATANDDGTVTLVNVNSHNTQTISTDVQQKIRFLSLDFSNDGNLLAAAGEDTFVWVWKVNPVMKSSSLYCSPFKSNSNQIDEVAFLPLEGKYQLATRSSDKHLGVWDIDARHQEKFVINDRTFTDDNVVALSVAPGLGESVRLVTGTDTGRIRVHLFGEGGLDQLLMQARRRASRAWLQQGGGQGEHKGACPDNLKEECEALQNAPIPALTSVIEANELARTGDADSVDKAAKKYEEVNRLANKILIIQKPQEEAEQLAEESHRERAENYGQSDNWEKAINEYKQIKHWNHLFDAAQTLASRSTYKNSAGVEEAFIREAMNLHRLGREAYKGEDPKALAKHDNYMCWYGSWWRYYDPELQQTCEEISKVDPDPAYADTQGVYFALASECAKDDKDNYRKKAIDIFTSYVNSSMSKEKKAVRADWIRILEKPDTIFTSKNVEYAVGKLTPKQFELIQTGWGCH